MKVERLTVPACCGNTGIMFKTDQPISLSHKDSLVKLGFTEREHFTKAGILYVDNLEFTLTGPIGSDRLQVKCRVANCDAQKLNNLEAILNNIG